MPSNPAAKEEKEKDAKARSKSDKKDAGRTERPKERSVEEIDAEIWETTVKTSLQSHGGWLGSLVLQSSTAGASSIPMLLTLLLTLFILLCALPPSTTFHLSAALTLLIPLQNTIKCIAQIPKGKDKDSAQWLQYWVTWTLLGMVQGWIGIVRPHWRWVYEIWKTVTLGVLAGPWFGRRILLPEKTALLSERKAAEEREKVKAKAEAKDAEAKAKAESVKRKKEKEREEKEEAEKEKKDKEKREKEKTKKDKEKGKGKEKEKTEKMT